MQVVLKQTKTWIPTELETKNNCWLGPSEIYLTDRLCKRSNNVYYQILNIFIVHKALLLKIFKICLKNIHANAGIDVTLPPLPVLRIFIKASLLVALD